MNAGEVLTPVLCDEDEGAFAGVAWVVVPDGSVSLLAETGCRLERLDDDVGIADARSKGEVPD